MKKTDSQYVPLREAFASNRRLFLMWWKNYPGILASITVCEALGAVMPYAGIWFSARIVGELAGARRAAVLVRLVLLALGSECLLAVLRAALTRWQKSQSACVYQIMQKFEMDKMLDMDFCDADSTRVHDLRSQAFQARNWSGWGLSRLIHQWPDLIRALVQIAGGAALTASLFMLRVPEGSPLSFLNHPLCLILIGAVLLGSTLLAPVLGNRSEGYWTRYAESAKMGNRSFGFYGFMGYDSYRAGDIRLYRQDILCDLYMKKENLFGANSGIARAARGPMGLLNAASAAVSHSFTGIVYLFVCLKALGGAFGAGLVTQYVASAASFSQGLSKLISTLGGMRANAFFLRTEFELLDIPEEEFDKVAAEFDRLMDEPV